MLAWKVPYWLSYFSYILVSFCWGAPHLTLSHVGWKGHLLPVMSVKCMIIFELFFKGALSFYLRDLGKELEV
jgi:hypothetical protein